MNYTFQVVSIWIVERMRHIEIRYVHISRDFPPIIIFELLFRNVQYIHVDDLLYLNCKDLEK